MNVTIDDTHPEDRLWRTQIVVESDIGSRGLFTVSLPAWQCDDLVTVSAAELTDEMRSYIRKGFRCFARANIGTDDPTALRIEGWGLFTGDDRSEVEAELLSVVGEDALIPNDLLQRLERARAEALDAANAMVTQSGGDLCSEAVATERDRLISVLSELSDVVLHMKPIADKIHKRLGIPDYDLDRQLESIRAVKAAAREHLGLTV